MPTLQVRDVPEELYRKLVRKAEEEHRSLSKQTIAVLEQGLNMAEDPKARRLRALARAKELRLGEKGGWPDFVKLIREARDSR